MAVELLWPSILRQRSSPREQGPVQLLLKATGDPIWAAEILADEGTR